MLLRGEVVGVLIYERHGGVIELLHTVSDPEHRGEGVASVLARAALAEAKMQQLEVLVVCPFVERWLDRHPDQAVGLRRRSGGGQ